MVGLSGNVISYNGEIYNYLELRAELSSRWPFRSRSDTETILAAYDAFGVDCLQKLRGMFAFAIWDGRRLFAARDRFGIKPFYYIVSNGVLHFASEMKALLPFLPEIKTDADALAEYLTFQHTISEMTLFCGIKQLMPGHYLTFEGGVLEVKRYWDVSYAINEDHTERWFARQLREQMLESVQMHLRSDVPVGAYVSGGFDSSLVALLASREASFARIGFNGRFTDYPGYDESNYARAACEMGGMKLHVADITSDDFRESIAKVIYHLDAPVAGPGSFPQFIVSRLAAQHVKVVLGGQGGDELFGGYARYLVAYLEQSLKAAIDGTYRNGAFVVTPESIIPNLSVLREYKPLLAKFFSKGLFGPLDQRYLSLIDRSADMSREVDWQALDITGVAERFSAIFNSEKNVHKEAYFDSMTHFDFKCLLPALLQVEDRMSMAHGLESRVPFLDASIVELSATIPALIKFKGGQLKRFLKEVFSTDLPPSIVSRRDKMGFPVPLNEWLSGPLKGFVGDIFDQQRSRQRDLFNSEAILANFDKAQPFSRKTWGLLSLELWHQAFHDRAAAWRAVAVDPAAPIPSA